MTNINLEDIYTELQATPEGKVQLELAAQRALINLQAKEIEQLKQEAPNDTDE